MYEMTHVLKGAIMPDEPSERESHMKPSGSDMQSPLSEGPDPGRYLRNESLY